MIMRALSSLGVQVFGKFSQYRRDTKAAAAIELALTFPVFLTFVFLMIELALFHFASSAVQQGVFDYSRRLVTMTDKGKRSLHRDAIKQEILQFVGKSLVASMLYELGPVTETTDFKKKLTKNSMKDFIADKTKPIYLRVVAKRPSFAYAMFQPVLNKIGNAESGLFSDIDVLVVVPWPPQDS